MAGAPAGRRRRRRAPRRARADRRRAAEGSRAVPRSCAGAGLRVLDPTRVIAGPVCACSSARSGPRCCASDPPTRPDVEPGEPADTLLGKRSAFLDLATEVGSRRLDALLVDADVVLLGYRPGALAGFGLAPEELADRHPGLVVMEPSPPGGTPAPGTNAAASTASSRPRAASPRSKPTPRACPARSPCQLLDHGTGYLAAAAVLDALAEQRERGGTHLARSPRPHRALVARRGGGGGGGPAAPWDEAGSSRSRSRSMMTRRSPPSRRPLPRRGPAAVARPRAPLRHGGAGLAGRTRRLEPQSSPKPPVTART